MSNTENAAEPTTPKLTVVRPTKYDRWPNPDGTVVAVSREGSDADGEHTGVYLDGVRIGRVTKTRARFDLFSRTSRLRKESALTTVWFHGGDRAYVDSRSKAIQNLLLEAHYGTHNV